MCLTKISPINNRYGRVYKVVEMRDKLLLSPYFASYAYNKYPGLIDKYLYELNVEKQSDRASADITCEELESQSVYSGLHVSLYFQLGEHVAFELSRHNPYSSYVMLECEVKNEDFVATGVFQCNLLTYTEQAVYHKLTPIFATSIIHGNEVLESDRFTLNSLNKMLRENNGNQ